MIGSQELKHRSVSAPEPVATVISSVQHAAAHKFLEDALAGSRAGAKQSRCLFQRQAETRDVPVRPHDSIHQVMKRWLTSLCAPEDAATIGFIWSDPHGPGCEQVTCQADA